MVAAKSASPKSSRRIACGARLTAAGAAFALVAAAADKARAERIENQIAVFAALDKVTARISKLEVPLGETVQFGALKVTARVCYSRPPTEEPKTTTFAEVDEIGLDGQQHRIFSGWMFAESPGLNAVEHPVFDVWLTECQKPAKSVAQRPAQPAGQQGGAASAKGQAAGQGPGQAQPSPEDAPTEPRRRIRR